MSETTSSTSTSITATRVAKLRELLQNADLKGCIITASDSHLSEYIAPCFKRRDFMSGFTGSAGVMAVTLSHAALWTDGRYYLQAEKQLDDNVIQLQREGLPETPTMSEWLIRNAGSGARIGVDAKSISINDAKRYGEGIELISMSENLIDIVWDSDRPPFPSNQAVVHSLEFAGKSTSEKVDEIRKSMEQHKADVLVVAALDEVAWLLNVRGSDIKYNPVVLSYALVTASSVIWYIHESKVSDEVRQHVSASSVEIRAYEQIFDDLRELSAAGQRVWLDGSKGTLALLECVNADTRIDENSPLAIPKAIKNDTEVDGLRQSSLRDSAALVNFFSWLEDELNSSRADELTEVSVADKLLSFRREQNHFVSESFATISSSGANGSIIHYKPEKHTCAKVVKDQVFLCDSGGQYRDGTTDVTRTFHFGTPSEHQRRCYTRVLQGHIAVASAVFPHGTTGHKLDVLARVALWKDGLDFRHGTGHGFGSFLNVHEGPTLISFRESTRGCYFSTPLLPNMTVTIEPGYYEDGAFGVRIENCTLIRNATTPHQFGGAKYYTFEPLTLVPIQTRMVDVALLTHDERAWLNAYHRQVAESVGPLVSGRAKEWLEQETREI